MTVANGKRNCTKNQGENASHLAQNTHKCPSKPPKNMALVSIGTKKSQYPHLTNHLFERMILMLLETEVRIQTPVNFTALTTPQKRGFLCLGFGLDPMGWAIRLRKQAWAYFREVCLGGLNLFVPPRLICEFQTSLGGLSRRATMSEQRANCAATTRKLLL
ncbi:hypothetical protein, partial [Maritalea sp.]|uniref:hypothetical protein n=1 Tax=Maritalea sp. TaxID=2003361 RepID=UPI0039E5E9B3